jgi:hypothetical protein
MIRWDDDPGDRLKLDIGRRTFAAGKIPAETRVLRVECGWCRRVMRNGHRPVSTGICEPCMEEHFPHGPH